MRQQSHISIGNFLLRRYFPGISDCRRKAFLFGCIQPDRNPFTYLKGSLRCQWLRGHNYPNAQRYMARISRRLERKDHWNLLDYYTLGKLIHYTVDAFTYAHNEDFPHGISGHMEYEALLQAYFLEYIHQDPPVTVCRGAGIMDIIRQYHRRYRNSGFNIYRDSRFALQTCCGVVVSLLTHESSESGGYLPCVSYCSQPGKRPWLPFF